ncbi:50S ribosomal protein L35 [bacterium]|nr:50S ribosomal protein L35 [bacterium]
MPKQKTHKGISKRFKVTASGKATKRSAFRGHILSKKNGKRKRHLRHNTIVVGADARHILEALRPAS